MSRGVYPVLIVSATYFSLSQSFVTPIMPRLKEQFGIDQEAVTWLMTGYLLIAAVSTPLIGQLGDRFGRGRLLFITIAIFTAANFVAAFSPSFELLVVSRMLQGVGAGVFPLAFGIVRDIFPGEKIAGAIGLLSSVMSIGHGVGLVGAGPILEVASYGVVFLALGALGVVLCVVLWFVTPAGNASATGAGGSDAVGVVLLIAWVGSILYAATQGNALGWLSWPIIGLVLLSGLTLMLWSWWERRHPNPLINMHTLRRPVVMVGNIVAMLFGVLMFSSSTFIMAYLQAPPSGGFGLGASVTVAGMLLLPQAAIFLLTGLAAGWIAHNIGPRRAVMIGAAVTTVSFGVMAFWNGSYTSIAIMTGAASIGMGVFFSQITNLILPSVPPGETSAVTGMNQTVRYLGGALGGQVFAAIIGSAIAVNGAFNGGYQLVFLALGLTALVASLLCTRIPK